MPWATGWSPRSGYGVEPRALALWPSISDALRQLESSIAPGTSFPAEASSTFTLAMADATAAELVPDLVEILERDAPGVSVRVLPLTTRDPRRLLDEGTVDLAVGFFPPVLADLTAQAQGGSMPAFEHERLYDGRYVCVMRKGHRLARGAMTLDRYCEAAPHAGELLRAALRLHRRGAGLARAAAAVVLTVNQFFTAGLVVENSRTCSPCCRSTSSARPGAPSSWCSASCRSRCRRCTWTPSGTGTRRRGRTTHGCGPRSPAARKGFGAGER